MTRTRGWPYAAALAALSVSTSTGCPLYTDPINVAPTVEIEAPAEVHRLTKAMFGARVRDPDGDRLVRLEWFAGKPGEACPATMAEAAALVPDARHKGTTFEVGAKDMRPFCVWVVARDKHGAGSFANHLVQVTNRKPSASIQYMSSFTAATQVPLYSTVRLTAAAMDEDTDVVTTFEWTVMGPNGAVVFKTSADGRECSFPVLAPGPHFVKLRATDGIDWSEWDKREVMVAADADPCIRLTTPPPGLVVHTLDDQGLARSSQTLFEVLRVEDDGDPYPAPTDVQSRGQFTWWLRTGKTFDELTRTDNRLPLNINSSHIGLDFEVRVAYRDRVGDRAKGCDVDQAVCSLGPDCPQWVTWKVMVR